MATEIHRVTMHASIVAGVELMSIESNRRFPRHSHDQFGMGVIRKGAHRSWSGMGQVEAGAGDVIMVNPGEMHDGMPIDGVPRTWQMLYCDPGLVSSCFREAGARDCEVVRPVARDVRLARRFDEVFAACGCGTGDGLALEETLVALLSATFELHGARRSGYDGPVDISAAMARMNNCPELPASLKELSALCGVSPFHFLRSFKASTGITPHAYLTQVRVKLSRRLLAQGVVPVEVALRSGFTDQSHLTRVFRRQIGVTPGRYQRALR